MLQIETVNACNARCVFCAYPGMQREKGIMSLQLFRKIVQDYTAMGGGAVSLTPVLGEPLLDPHLLERIAFLQDNPAIRQISMTTNAIALEKYSNADVSYLLNALDFIQFSVGGLDSETYRTMFGVDHFDRITPAMDRLLALNEKVSSPAEVAFAFRTNDWTFEKRFRRELGAYRNRGVEISHLWTYANYGGLVANDKNLGLEVNEGTEQKDRPCALACVHLAVCWDGTITACGCADAEGRGLMLGRADRNSLAEVWAGEKRARILDSFEKGALPEICRKCSAYRQDSVFSCSSFAGIKPGHSLPADFYHQFWGA